VQVRSAAEEYHAEFAAKEATIASLTAEAESARSHMQAEIDKLRSDMEVWLCLASRCMRMHAGYLECLQALSTGDSGRICCHEEMLLTGQGYDSLGANSGLKGSL